MDYASIIQMLSNMRAAGGQQQNSYINQLLGAGRESYGMAGPRPPAYREPWANGLNQYPSIANGYFGNADGPAWFGNNAPGSTSGDTGKNPMMPGRGYEGQFPYSTLPYQYAGPYGQVNDHGPVYNKPPMTEPAPAAPPSIPDYHDTQVLGTKAVLPRFYTPRTATVPGTTRPPSTGMDRPVGSGMNRPGNTIVGSGYGMGMAGPRRPANSIVGSNPGMGMAGPRRPAMGMAGAREPAPYGSMTAGFGGAPRKVY